MTVCTLDSSTPNWPLGRTPTSEVPTVVMESRLNSK